MTEINVDEFLQKAWQEFSKEIKYLSNSKSFANIVLSLSIDMTNGTLDKKINIATKKSEML